MKRITSLLIAVLLALNTSTASAAPSCAESLGNLFTPFQRVQLCKIFGSAIPNSEIPATDNTFDLGTASKQWRTLYIGTSIVNSGDEIIATAAKGLVAGASARAANVTTATTLAVPLYITAAASGTDLGAFVGYGATTSGPVVDLFKTRATSGQATTIVVSGDTLGTIKFLGANGTGYDPAAAIIVTSDATPGASADMPGAIDLQTTPDGSATLASALKLKNDKSATFGGQLRSVAANEEVVAGAGTNQGNAAALSATKNFHQITGANNTVGWIFATPVAGDFHLLMNTTAGIALIYPQSGGTINGGSANAAFTALTGIKPILCFATSTTAWICS